jgi:MFS family permease
VFLHLFALLVCSAVSYGFYLLTARIFSPEVAEKMNGTEIIDTIVMSILIGVTSSVMSLVGAFGILGLAYHLGWRYRVSPLGQFIARLPGIRLISYVHRKYWLPSGNSLSPRPRFFYMKRFIIRQSELPRHFRDLYLLNYISWRC